MILVIGASGLLGEEVCRLLSVFGSPVRAMVRKESNPAKIAALENMGVDLVEGDLKHRETFAAALDGVEKVIVTTSSIRFSELETEDDIKNVDLLGMSAFIEAAEASGIEHFVYTSLSGHVDLDFPLRNAKRAIELKLQQGSMPYTILRPSCYMEYWFTPEAGFDIGRGEATVFGQGDQRISFISGKDVARFAFRCVEHPSTMNATLEIGGPDRLSQIDAIRIFEEVLHHPFKVKQIPMMELAEAFDAATNPKEKSLIGLKLCMAKGDYITMDRKCHDFQIKLTSAREFAKTYMAVA